MQLTSIHLYTNDLAATATFYTRQLQLAVIQQSSTRISLRAGASTLEFEHSNAIVHPVYHFAFNIPHNQLNEAVDRLQQMTSLIPVTGDSPIAHFELWHADAIYFYDNNGNLLEFIARHDLLNAAPELHIDSISEIGIVTENVPACVASFLQQPIPVFAKQPRSDQFTALGDDHGLLIIAAAGRNWFPTCTPAQHFPGKVTISHEEMVHTFDL
ncbi:catechol-2,3-dioxygenase [Chitinophaga polysaccharea]|uniref:Catechol-2,3-dioxygenase n=1 Tax=Chitinophaga polysaccharea TaxID=1293035 RepID=A0A561PNY5_9BACT|nr:VOC family protein [Chitinophaga polysaccharea]TWF39817.1 catechol-2,3-dioxygenase [Chitinophaga polysaccharea]